MNGEEWVRYLGLQVTEAQLLAVRQLESRGQVFAVDFGLDNCEDKLFRLMEEADE